MNAQLQYDLLQAWEAGLDQGPCQRGLDLLRAITGGASAALEDISFGERDHGLLSLRERLFGTWLHATHACPACGSLQEFDLEVQSLRSGSLPAATCDSHLVIDVDGYVVHFRLPVVGDALALEADTGAAVSVESALLERCVVSAQFEGRAVSAAELPPVVRAAVSARMAEADPQAEIELAFECTECAEQWIQALDIAAYLWEEVHAWALRTFHEVHCLAAAYGWSEREVLAVSPRRRSLYLEMIGDWP